MEFSFEVASAISRAAAAACHRGADRVRSVDVLMALLAAEGAGAGRVLAAVIPGLQASVLDAAMPHPGEGMQSAPDRPIPLSAGVQSVMRDLRCRPGAGTAQSTDLLLALAQQATAAGLLRRCGVQLEDLESACARENRLRSEPAAQAASAQSSGRAGQPVAACTVPDR